MKKIILIFTIAFSLFCTGCDNKEQISNSNPETTQSSLDYVIDNLSSITYMNNGVIYYDDYRLYYFDTESNLSTIICSDPSCKHEKPTYDKKSDCMAVIDGMNINSLAYIGDKLYFSYGESGEEFTYKTFFTADIDGSNRREIAKVAAENIENTVYTDSSIIVSYTNTLDLTDGNSVSLNELTEWESGIYSIDITDGKTQLISTHMGNHGKINKMSCDGENVYYLFEYTEGIINQSELYKYNIKSQKEEKLNCFENSYFNGGFSSTGMLYTQETDNGNELHNYSFNGEDSLIAQGENLSNYFYYDDQRIIYCIYESDSAHYCLYDSETRQTKSIGKLSSELPVIYAVVDNKIYLSTSNDIESSYGIGYLNKEDFVNGNFDEIITVK